jgi:hypothetical protein
MEEIMNVETPPAAGELDFAANKEAYERYFINVAGILASNNEFNGPFLDHLNKTLEITGLVLTSKDSIENYAMDRMVAVAAEGERLRRLDRTRYINEFRETLRRALADERREIAALKKQLEENNIEMSAEVQRLENAAIRDLDSPENSYFFNTIDDPDFKTLMENEIPPGIFTPEGTPKKPKKRRRKAGGAANRKLDPELGGSSLKDRGLRF